MRFTEHEMTSALTGLAKHQLSQTHPEGDEAGFDVEKEWDSIPKYERYKVLNVFGDLVLPVFIALPDVEVAPGTQPTFTDEQVIAAAQQVVAADEAADRPQPGGGSVEEALRDRAIATRAALQFLPVRQDPDGLLTVDANDFVVPDTLEGL